MQENNLPSNEKDLVREETSFAVQIILFIVALSVMVLVMYYSIDGPYPSGKPLDITSFVLLWMRELVILVFVALGIAAALGAWLTKLCRRVF